MMSNANDLLATVVGGGGVLGLAGAGIRFVWNKLERRFLAIEKELAACRARELASEARRGVHLAVIELLWHELKRVAPAANDATLARAKKLLDGIKRKD